MKICPKCHASNRDDAKFCTQCGTPIPAVTTKNPNLGEQAMIPNFNAGQHHGIYEPVANENVKKYDISKMRTFFIAFEIVAVAVSIAIAFILEL